MNVQGAAFAARLYLEHSDLRSILTSISPRNSLRSICEIGCGYGRLLPVLREFSEVVVGFEREQHFVETASRLFPDVRVAKINRLSNLPCNDESFDLALTFTVLQHLFDEELPPVVAELVRVLKSGAFLLICEETDPTNRRGAVNDPTRSFCIGRPVKEYSEWFRDFGFVRSWPRRVETTYPQLNNGDYVLFQKLGNFA